MSVTYVVKTNLPPEQVTRIGLEIFAKWIAFARGKDSIAGRMLIYPTGKYASSISFQRENESTVAIIADESVAPEVGILESGHGRIDLKTRLRMNKAYKMHRPVGATAGATTRRIGSRPVAPMRISVSSTGAIRSSKRPQMWAQLRSSTASGFASFGPNSAPDSWIIPPMPAYAPAANLAILARQMAGS